MNGTAEAARPEMMKLRSWSGEYDTFLDTSTYFFGGGLYIQILCMDGNAPEPYADLTVNLPDYPLLNENCAFVDTNNFAGAADYIRENKLGRPTGRLALSGYCVYPEYEFDMAEVQKHLAKPPDKEQKPVAR